TYDFGIGRRLSNLSYLRTLGDHINRRVLETECVAHDCGLAPAQLADLIQPTQTRRRTPGAGPEIRSAPRHGALECAVSFPLDRRRAHQRAAASLSGVLTRHGIQHPTNGLRLA